MPCPGTPCALDTVHAQMRYTCESHNTFEQTAGHAAAPANTCTKNTLTLTQQIYAIYDVTFAFRAFEERRRRPYAKSAHTFPRHGA